MDTCSFETAAPHEALYFNFVRDILGLTSSIGRQGVSKSEHIFHGRATSSNIPPSP
jgi:hypothetical protein